LGDAWLKMATMEQIMVPPPRYFFWVAVKPGLFGKHPSLTDLDNGDLKFSTDFRSVYATVLDKWLRAPSQLVLGKKFSTLPIV
jgi:uncharacterized protein (DUF1501 family)